jgi:hypothetical protein
MNLGNWGKRELSTSSSTPDFIKANLDTNDDGTSISAISDGNSMNNFLLEQLRLVNTNKEFFVKRKYFIMIFLESISTTITSIIGIGIEFFVYLNEKSNFFLFK